MTEQQDQITDEKPAERGQGSVTIPGGPNATRIEDRLGLYFIVGGSSTDNRLRRVGPQVISETGGWPKFVECTVMPALSKHGIRLCELHNPQGYTSDESVMDFDQYVEAIEQNMPWLTNHFAQSLHSIVSGYDCKCGLIVYYGSLLNDLGMRALESRPRAYAARIRRSLMSVLQVSHAHPMYVSLAFDNCSAAPADSMTFQAMREIRQEIRLYCEGRVKQEFPHMAIFGAFTTAQFGGGLSELDDEPTPPWAVPWNQYPVLPDGGPPIQMIVPMKSQTSSGNYGDWMKRRAALALGHGQIALLPPTFDQHFAYEDLIAEAYAIQEAVRTGSEGTA